MSKFLITATKIVSPAGKTTLNTGETAQVVYVESDKFQIFQRDSNTKAVIIANGYQYDVDSEVAELAAALGAEDMSAYT